MKRLVIHVKIAVFRNVCQYLDSHIERYSLRKSLHNHRCYVGFNFKFRLCHMICCICIAISESGNTNSQVNKPNAWMCWFLPLISISLGGFDVNCLDNISMLQNWITYLKNNCHSESYEAGRSPVFPCIGTAIPSFRHSRCRCTWILHFWSVIGSRI